MIYSMYIIYSDIRYDLLFSPLAERLGPPGRSQARILNWFEEDQVCTFDTRVHSPSSGLCRFATICYFSGARRDENCKNEEATWGKGASRWIAICSAAFVPSWMRHAQATVATAEQPPAESQPVQPQQPPQPARALRHRSDSGEVGLARMLFNNSLLTVDQNSVAFANVRK